MQTGEVIYVYRVAATTKNMPYRDEENRAVGKPKNNMGRTVEPERNSMGRKTYGGVIKSMRKPLYFNYDSILLEKWPALN